MQPHKNSKLAILLVYASSQTFTPTVFAHVESFGKYSEHIWYYLDYLDLTGDQVNIECFDVVVIHYSVRLPFGQLCASGIKKLNAFSGLKVLFIQDEYDFTDGAKSVIQHAGFQLIFTVVPKNSISLIYPPDEFTGVTFISNLTGYVPDDLSSELNAYIPPSQRDCVIAYRGRSLPIRYGRLGQEKIQIGKQVQAYCQSKNIKHDIAWTEQHRIYGDGWYQFISSTKAMLGSESGSNVFDWDGSLQNKINQYQKLNPKASELQIYDAVVAPQELDGVMNQVSPRIFEMIAARTAMVLFEGNYSGVLIPHRHYIPLRKDFSNLDEIFSLLDDGEHIDKLVEDAYQDVIGCGIYSYQAFVALVDQHINTKFKNCSAAHASNDVTLYRRNLKNISEVVLKNNPPSPFFAYPFKVSLVTGLKYKILRALYVVWMHMPQSFRFLIKKILAKV
jgi:hypothetical protein